MKKKKKQTQNHYQIEQKPLDIYYIRSVKRINLWKYYMYKNMYAEVILFANPGNDNFIFFLVEKQWKL
jgi:hypothetical protein